jgi:hypothetical protein
MKGTGGMLLAMANSYVLIQSAVYRHLAQVGPESSACLVRSHRLRSALPAAVTSPHRTWAARVLATLHELERQGRVTSAGSGMVGDPRVWAVAEGSSAPKRQAGAQRPGQRENATTGQPEALATFGDSPEEKALALAEADYASVGSPAHEAWHDALVAAQPLDRRGRSARGLTGIDRVPGVWLRGAEGARLCSVRERGGQPWLYPPRGVSTSEDSDGDLSPGQSEDIGNVHVDNSETEANGAVSDLAGLGPDTVGQ